MESLPIKKIEVRRHKLVIDTMTRSLMLSSGWIIMLIKVYNGGTK